MRILRLLVGAFLIFVVIIVVAFFFTRESLLYWGASNLKNSLRGVVVAKNRGSFISQCEDLGSKSVGGEPIASYQIRFVTSSEYLSEVVCQGFEYDPIIIEQAQLPPFVTKVPGTSGFIVSFVTTGVELEVFQKELSKLSSITGLDFSFLSKRKRVVVQNGVVIKADDSVYLNDGPVTVCSGYGYQCCDEVSQFGVGDRIVGLSDCEDSCYSSCASRPVLLSFNSNPLMDPKTRTVEVDGGGSVQFTFVADSGKAKSMNGVLDFGDGKKVPVSGLAGQVSHNYDCNLSRCKYLARLTLEDNWGVKSADLETNKIMVIVTK